MAVNSDNMPDMRQRKVQAEAQNGKAPEPAKEKAPEPGKVTFDSMIAFEERISLLHCSENNYRGFVNVLIILLVLGNARIVIQNMYKYGWLVEPWSFFAPAKWPNVILTCSLLINFLIAFAIQRSSRFLPKRFVLTLDMINIVASFCVPWAGLWLSQANPAGGVITLVYATTAVMKLTSFAARWRALQENAAKENKTYQPTLGELFYFVAAPTCVFSPSYPRTKEVRWFWVFKRIVEFCGIWFAIYFLAGQYVVPSLSNTMTPLEKGNIILVMEGMLKIAVPNFMIWLLGFYSIFHIYLNVLAELTRFGDRQFYQDWWNSTTVSFFWRSWNLPVHQFMVAHVYIPMLGAGFKKNHASVVIFFFSALMHELIVSIPFCNFKLLAFGGMMAQIPLIEMTNRFKGTQTGNFVFWLSIMLGQPLIVLLYARDYYFGLHGPWTEADTKTVMNALGMGSEA
mmetsp:Transcript_1134/g.2219  ORF Transcript_1134/g.2219 Transcript_1134/m.2219 type:complete len:455 (+) Transcript_1134:114-1478(+)